jgi:hypothetical protein
MVNLEKQRRSQAPGVEFVIWNLPKEGSLHQMQLAIVRKWYFQQRKLMF